MPQTQETAAKSPAAAQANERARRIVGNYVIRKIGFPSMVGHDAMDGDYLVAEIEAAILEASQSETREAGPDLLDKATEPCRVPDTHKIPPDTEVAVSKLDNATDREAWLQGYWAHAFFGLDLDMNPYEEHRVWKAWFEGWQWADAEDEG